MCTLFTVVVHNRFYNRTKDKKVRNVKPNIREEIELRCKGKYSTKVV